MSRSDFERIYIKIEDLHLWLENPRLTYTQHDERACIEKLLEEPSFYNLVADITENGLGVPEIVVSPDSDNGYTVRDGNRRVAALKLIFSDISYPQHLSGIEKKINELKLKFNPEPIQGVECLSSGDEVVINHHIVKTHSGEQSGRGQVAWDALMVATHQHNLGIQGPNTLSYRFLLLGRTFNYKFEEGYPITTLSRLPLRTFCDRAGIEIPDDISKPLEIKENKVQQASSAVLKILEQIGDGSVNVSTSGVGFSIRGSGEPQNYIDSIIEEFNLENPTENTEQESASNSSDSSNCSNKSTDSGEGDSDGSTSNATGPSRKPRQKRSEERDKFILTARHTRVPTSYIKASNIFSEMLRLSSKNSPITCAVMLRVFLETTIKEVVGKLEIAEKKNLREKVQNVLVELKCRGEIDEPLARKISSLCKNTPKGQFPEEFFSIDTLQSFVHSKYFHPKKEDVNLFWDDLDEFIAKCWEMVVQIDKEKG